ncbi:MAG: hypothetical protein HC894_09990 [Microcoleus sp. SM1_3_4]|nr:hypothetical protein [Microcoleus sp. SM1_3_4]
MRNLIDRRYDRVQPDTLEYHCHSAARFAQGCQGNRQFLSLIGGKPY